MRHLIAGAGAALLLAGLVSFYWSIDLAGIERGTAFAVSGAVLTSAGVATLALARIASLLERVVSRVERIEGETTSPERIAPPAAPSEGAALAASMAAAALGGEFGGDAAAQPPAPAPAERDARDVDVEPVAAAATRPDPGVEPMAITRATSVGSPAPAPAPEPAPSAAAEPAADDAKAIEAESTAKPDAPATPSRWTAPPRLFPNAFDDAPVTGETQAPEPAPIVPPAPPPSPEPRLVGRYKANGIDYSLYSDGAIETEEKGEKRRFSSLSELKAFIER